jgi:hypothetical protein
MNPCFDHEKLEVYRESLAFIAWLEPLMQKLPKAISVRDQLDRASTSIVLNVAEGNGKVHIARSLPLFRHFTRLRFGVCGCAGCSGFTGPMRISSGRGGKGTAPQNCFNARGFN